MKKWVVVNIDGSKTQAGTAMRDALHLIPDGHRVSVDYINRIIVVIEPKEEQEDGTI